MRLLVRVWVGASLRILLSCPEALLSPLRPRLLRRHLLPCYLMTRLYLYRATRRHGTRICRVSFCLPPIFGVSGLILCFAAGGSSHLRVVCPSPSKRFLFLSSSLQYPH